MSGDFVDSNVIVYMFDRDDDAKRTMARRIIREGISSRGLAISFRWFKKSSTS